MAKIRYIVPSLIVAVMALQSCSDDPEDEPAQPEEPTFGFTNLKGSPYSTGVDIKVYSEPGPKSGEKHRSSDNFSMRMFEDYGHDPEYLLVSCPKGVTFDINVDRSGKDEVWNNDVYNGAILPYRYEDKFYIANPTGATEQFSITLTALYPKEGCTIVSSPMRPLEGEKHRASLNFRLDGSATRYIVHTDGVVHFSIYEDRSGSDYKMATDVHDSDIINFSPSRRNLYIRDVDDVYHSGYDSFHILFEPITVEWMTALEDDRSIADITIPGTHDAGTYALEPVNFGYSKCQNMDVWTQLDFGIRYLDLRVDNSMDIEHGGLPCNVSFDEITRTTCDFLKKHPGETVIFELSGHEGFGDKFKNYLNSNSDVASYFWLENYVPKLKEVRGKIMVIRRYAWSGKQGLDFSGDVWPYDGSKEGTNADGIKYYIEDRYFSSSSTQSHDTHIKRDVLYEAMNYKREHAGVLCIAFASVSASVSHTPYQFMWGGGAPAVNPIMSDVLFHRLNSSPLVSNDIGWGIIPMDYFNANGHDDFAHVVEDMISSNFMGDDSPFYNHKFHSSYDE